MNDAAAVWGLRVEEPEEPEEEKKPDHEIFYLWPCNVEVWSIWWRIQTQWRIGVQGREGLDYKGVGYYLREIARIRPRKIPEVFACLQAMERAACEEWDKQRAAAQANRA